MDKPKYLELDINTIKIRRLVWHEGNPYDPAGIYAILEMEDSKHPTMVFVTYCSEPPYDLQKDDEL